MNVRAAEQLVQVLHQRIDAVWASVRTTLVKAAKAYAPAPFLEPGQDTVMDDDGRAQGPFRLDGASARSVGPPRRAGRGPDP